MSFKKLQKRFRKVRKEFPGFISRIDSRRKVIARKTYRFTQVHPFRALFMTLGLFLLLMVLGNVFFAPKPEPAPALSPKEVKVFSIGKAPEISYQGKIEKSGVVKVVAQSPGIVASINVNEGQEVFKGTSILSLSTNYQGGNALSVARQIAATQYQTTRDTYDTQKEIIAKQRDLANKNKDNTELLRQISAQSAIDTENLAKLDQSIVDSINANIVNLEATNIGGVNDAAILQAKQSLSQFQAALIQATSSLKSLQVQSNSASSDAMNINRDIAVKQLDVQEKTLKMTLDVARLQLSLAQVNEASMFPSSPFAGAVNKIFVTIGESVNPGTVLASISGNDQTAEVIVNVPEDIAKSISVFEESTIYLQDGTTILMLPTFISRDATDGTLYSVIYNIEDPIIPDLTDDSFVEVRIPIGVADYINIDPYVPLDAIVQTQEEAYVFIADDKNIARSKKVVLGQIQGRYVQILSGIPDNAKIILNRNVIEGDRINISH